MIGARDSRSTGNRKPHALLSAKIPINLQLTAAPRSFVNAIFFFSLSGDGVLRASRKTAPAPALYPDITHAYARVPKTACHLAVGSIHIGPSPLTLTQLDGSIVAKRHRKCGGIVSNGSQMVVAPHPLCRATAYHRTSCVLSLL